MQFFEEIPYPRSPRERTIDWAEIRRELMENPGMWGLAVTNVSSSTPGQLHRGENSHFRGDDLAKFRFKVRRPKNPETPYGPRRSDLYGRYTPEGASNA